MLACSASPGSPNPEQWPTIAPLPISGLAPTLPRRKLTLLFHKLNDRHYMRIFLKD